MMKTSGKILTGLLFATIIGTVAGAVISYRHLTNTKVNREITKYYSSINVNLCDTVIVHGSISVTLDKNDTVGIKFVTVPANSSDSVIVKVINKSLHISSTDTSASKPVPEIKLNLNNLGHILSYDHAQLYVKGFIPEKLTTRAENKSYIGLNEVTADSLFMISYDNAATAELSFPIECDSLVNKQRELYLTLMDKSYLNVWGSYGSMKVQRSPAASIEVYNIKDKLKTCR